MYEPGGNVRASSRFDIIIALIYRIVGKKHAPKAVKRGLHCQCVVDA